MQRRLHLPRPDDKAIHAAYARLRGKLDVSLEFPAPVLAVRARWVGITVRATRRSYEEGQGSRQWIGWRCRFDTRAAAM